MKTFLLGIALAISTASLVGQEISNDSILSLIRKHGIEKSKVAEIASWITDVYGPRLTGSPMLDKATEWATTTMRSWGMSNVHLEEWGPFGRGWELEHFEMHATSSGGYWPVLAYPKAWSPSVSGEGEVIYLDANTEEELKSYEGKLAGKFVLLDTIRPLVERFDPLATRHEAESLLELANQGLPTPRPRRDFTRRQGGFNFNSAMWILLQKEKPLAVLDRGYKGDYGTVFVQGARVEGGSVRDDTTQIIPQVTLSVEHYNRIFRLLNKGVMTTLSLDMRARYTNEDDMEHNIIAEIPGSDLGDKVVMFGAHFDSWHSGTGATDNGVGSAVMMEVARILLETIRESGVQPRRTLRLALWTGEEQGIYGSKNYVGAHYAELPPDSYTPQSLKPANSELSAYYNLDNGTGKIRGIHMQGNDQLVHLFREWLEPFADDGASTISLGNTGGTDHLPFAGIGIPAFQFIQEPMAYGSRTHHSNMDCWDHLVEDDMKQAAMIIASFVWNTAQLDEKLPRKEEVMER
ncbi:MAG TPA: M20/M25/M40 family metallo-hydrolase [Saprospiraceae bacterium]|nr:M20/M25/M40 family metallo-hydrolase [Saprospiraceae bacterium]